MQQDHRIVAVVASHVELVTTALVILNLIAWLVDILRSSRMPRQQRCVSRVLLASTHMDIQTHAPIAQLAVTVLGAVAQHPVQADFTHRSSLRSQLMSVGRVRLGIILAAAL